MGAVSGGSLMSYDFRLTNLPGLYFYVVVSGELTGEKTSDNVSRERLPHSAPATGIHRFNFGQFIYQLINPLFYSRGNW